MDLKYKTIDLEEILKMAERFETMTKEKPILITDYETIHKITQLDFKTSSGIPQRLLNFYGYSVVVFPHDSKFQNGIIYFYNYQQAKNAALEYLNNKAQSILIEMKDWVNDEARI